MSEPTALLQEGGTGGYICKPALPLSPARSVLSGDPQRSALRNPTPGRKVEGRGRERGVAWGVAKRESVAGRAVRSAGQK